MLGKVAVAAAAAFSVSKLVEFGKQAVETASDLAEVQNVVDTAFGSMADKMEKFADVSIKQFGISRLAAKQTGSTFMAMARGMNISMDNASDMAVALTGLSADMASFYNVEQDVASAALKSVFTGETETLKQFGIVMTEANLEAYALAQGINKSLSAMSQAEKVQLRYNYVMSQTALAQGDFAKTSDGWANQTRILSEQWKEFGSTVGTVLMTALLPAIKSLNTALSNLISFAQEAAQAIAAAFGIELQTGGDSTAGLVTDSSALADNSADAADNYESMAEAAEQAQKANEGSLASFDRINKLGDSKTSTANSSGSGASGVNTGIYGNQGTISTKVDIDTKEAENNLTKFLKRLKKTFSELFKPLQKAWDKNGKAVTDSAKKSLKNILGLVKEIGGSFKTVWTNGTGEKIVGHILDILKNINETIGNIADRLKTAWTTDNLGTDIIQHAADIFDTILSHVDNITGKISEWAKTLDFEPLLTALDNLLKAVEPFADTIGEGLEWFFDNVLLPLASFVIEDVVPNFLDLLAGVISALDAVIVGAQPTLTWLWDSVLQPFAKWTGGIIVSVIKDLTDKLKSFSDWAKENQAAMDTITSVILGFFAGIVFYYTVKKIVALIVGIKKAFEAFGTISFLAGGKIALAALAVGVLVAGIVEISKNWDKLAPAQQAITILGSLAAAAMAAAIAIAIFHTSWSVGIAAAAIAAGLTSLGLMTYFLNAGGDGGSTTYESASGVTHGGGGGSFAGTIDDDVANSYRADAEDFYNSYDFNSDFQLPKFASGAYVPANYGEFLAVLGDNKREAEFVAPESKLNEAVENAIRKYGNSSAKQPAIVYVMLDGKVAAKAVIDNINNTTGSSGECPISI
ncbi:hypothetical protein Osc1_04970 [Hominimerdicola sp. 21CYCFAH17_S]